MNCLRRLLAPFIGVVLALLLPSLVIAAVFLPLVYDPAIPGNRQLHAGDTLGLQASAAGGASINIPQGTAPTSPNNGDCWTTSVGLYCRINGVTQGPFGNLSLSAADQVLTGGFLVTSNNLGTISSGTTTIDCGARPLQYLTDNGAFTLAAPTNDSSCSVLVTNGASAGTITFSGFTVGASTGDALDTTNTHKFTIAIWRINSVAGYRIAAHQ